MFPHSTAPSHSHIWVRIIGHGLAITPLSDFEATWSAENSQALNIHLTNQKFARIIPADGGYRSQIDAQTTASLYEVATVELHAHKGSWRLETSLFSCAWPSSLTLKSTDLPKDITPFELIDDQGLLIYFQKPRNFPSLSALQGPGQTVVETSGNDSAGSILLGYQHEGSPWMQRHSVVSLSSGKVALCAQFPEEHKDQALDIVQTLESSLA